MKITLTIDPSTELRVGHDENGNEVFSAEISCGGPPLGWSPVAYDELAPIPLGAWDRLLERAKARHAASATKNNGNEGEPS